ncbi:MAG: hypothetical protein HQ546_00205, partial [Planctomycetes bacterium]|nr:hypothetical protein [Planctomycetota bacterium]
MGRKSISLAIALIVSLPTVAQAAELLPNGSFEWVERLDGDWLKQKTAAGFRVAGEPAVLPVTWNLDGPGSFAVVGGRGQVRSGEKAFAVEGVPGTSVSVGWIEVEPESTYTFTLWARGQGTVAAEYEQIVPESGAVGPRVEPIGRIQIKAVGRWTSLHQTRTFGANVYRVRIRIIVEGSVTLDDVSFTTTGRDTTPVSSLNTPAVEDEQATFVDHMDGALAGRASTQREIRFVPGAFGLGAQVGTGAEINYSNEKYIHPAQGTLELWILPNPASDNCDFIMVSGGGQATLRASYRSAQSFDFSWANRYSRVSDIRTGRLDVVDRGSDRDWHHLAFCWEKGVNRLYYDGLLIGIDDRAGLPIIDEKEPPRFFQIGSAYYFKTHRPGVDELRLSRSARYGMPGQVKAEVTQPVVQASNRQFGMLPADYEIRQPLLELYRPADRRFETAMDGQGRYVYGPASAEVLPSIEDPQGTQKLENITDGLPAGFLLRRSPQWYVRPYWAIGKIRPGNYYVGLQVRCDVGDDPLNASANTNGSDAPQIYIDGKQVSTPTMTAPVEIRPGEFIAEIRSTDPVFLKLGSRVVFRCPGGAFFANLVLWSKMPKPGPIYGGERWYSSGNSPYDLWAMSLNVAGRPEDGSPMTGRFSLLNIANRPVRLAVKCHVVDYFGRTLANREENIQLADLGRAEGEISFTPPPDSPHCRVELIVREIKTGQIRRKAYFVRTNVVEGARRKFLLNGVWDAVGVPDALEIDSAPPANAQWKQIDVPSELTAAVKGKLVPPEKVRSTHVVWFRKKLVLPPWLNGRRLILELTRCSFETRVFVNGREVGRHMTFAPYAVDVTDFLQAAGENEILIA